MNQVLELESKAESGLQRRMLDFTKVRLLITMLHSLGRDLYAKGSQNGAVSLAHIVITPKPGLLPDEYTDDTWIDGSNKDVN